MNPNLIYMMTFLPAIIYHNTDTNTTQKKDKDSPPTKSHKTKFPTGTHPSKTDLYQFFTFSSIDNYVASKTKRPNKNKNIRKGEKKT